MRQQLTKYSASVSDLSAMGSLPVQNLRVDTVGQVFYFPVHEIVRIEAVSCYSRLYFSNGKPMLVTKVLCRFEQLLKASGFIRVHRGHLINRQYMVSYSPGRAAVVSLKNGDKIPVAKRKRSGFRVLAG